MENNSMKSQIEDLVQLYRSGITYDVIDAFVKKTLGCSNQMSEYSHVKSIEEWKEHFAGSELSDLKNEVIKMVFDYLIKYYKEGFVRISGTKEIAIRKAIQSSDLLETEYIVLQTLSIYNKL
ncbi:hypothetical protein GWA97_10220 [Flavobacterium sp. LaA7.5]|nr:hypothetical protein [Flavobacterium salilacus subsp. altitudinum]